MKLIVNRNSYQEFLGILKHGSTMTPDETAKHILRNLFLMDGDDEILTV
jgi:hypothetical protein